MKVKLFGVLAALLVLSSVSVAGMWWQRGDAGTTWQDWTFDDADDPAVPELYYNPYGIPWADITVSGTVHQDPPGWYAEFLGRKGVWHGDFASVVLHIDNTRIPNPYKEIWVEVGFRGHLLPDLLYPDYPGNLYGPQVKAWLGNLPLQDIVMIGQPEITATGQGWQKLLIGWKIWPNPDLEEIYLAFHNSGADIDYIKVDTICVPEPATMILLGLGGLLLGRKK